VTRGDERRATSDDGHLHLHLHRHRQRQNRCRSTISETTPKRSGYRISFIETMVRVMIMKVLSVSGVLATSGSSSSSAFLIPAASSNNMMLPTSTSTSSRLRPQIISCYAREPTRIYYRDDDNASIDAMLGVERDQLPLPTTINPEDDYQTASSSDFRSRMRRILVQQQKNTSSSRRSNTLSVTSLEEYASVIEEGRREGRLVVVRFHATWCKVSNRPHNILSFIGVGTIPQQSL